MDFFTNFLQLKKINITLNQKYNIRILKTFYNNSPSPPLQTYILQNTPKAFEAIALLLLRRAGD